jgi:hypothetical protein
LATSKAK